MRFLDANVFIYAYYKSKRELSDKQKEMKEHAKEIIKRINEGEDVITTVIHLSKVSNILKKAIGFDDLHLLLLGLYSFDNIKIVDVTKEDYLAAIEMTRDMGLDPNDCLAVEIMRRERVDEIYTFDRGFDRVEGVKRVT